MADLLHLAARDRHDPDAGDADLHVLVVLLDDLAADLPLPDNDHVRVREAREHEEQDEDAHGGSLFARRRPRRSSQPDAGSPPAVDAALKRCVMNGR